MKRLLYVLLFLTVLSMILPAQELWQGNAAIIRRGELSRTGMYAASNSFATNTKIEVVNATNGKSATVTVIQRIEGASNVFLLLSEDAADNLGMDLYDVINVKVTVLEVDTSDIIGLPDDLPYNPDPDIALYFPPTPTPYPTTVPSPVATEEVFIVAATPVATIVPVPTEEVYIVEPTPVPPVVPTPVPTGEVFVVLSTPTPGPTPDIFITEPTPVFSGYPTVLPTPEVYLTDASAAPTLVPTPVPTKAVYVVEATIEPTAVPTSVPTPVPTSSYYPTPVSTVTPVITPTPVIYIIERTSEPTPVPTPVHIKDRTPQKNLFLPPREDKRFVLNDILTPVSPGEEDISTLAMKEADILLREDTPEADSLEPPEYKEEEKITDLLYNPGIEYPEVDDPLNKPDKIVRTLDRTSPEVPDVEIEELVVESPDPSGESIHPVLSLLDLTPTEPDLPLKELEGPEVADEMPEIPPESRLVLTPIEPLIREKPGPSVAEVGSEIPSPAKSETPAYVLSIPGVDELEAAIESPAFSKADPLNLAAAEPVLPGEKVEEKPEVAYERPESIISHDYPGNGKLRIPDVESPDTPGEIPGIEEDLLVLAPDEPVLPGERETLKPEYTGEIPFINVTKLDFEAGEPELPGEREKPDPSGEMPFTGEEELVMQPDEPGVPEDKERPDTDSTSLLAEEDTTGKPIDHTPDEPPFPEDRETITVTEVPEDGEPQIVLIPAGERPPGKETPGNVYIAAEVMDIESLEEKSYFIQLGSFKDKTIARTLENRFSTIYPIGIYSPPKTLAIYKVLLGPLNKAESDTLLYRFRNLGFRDAFVKYIN